ncbi:MAG: helix-turn-helix domain-containing protein [Hyphomicrobium sp.]|jgi:hypothetical protein
MPAGRPTKYKPEYAEQARKLCALGATDAQLADFFEVSISTVSLWKVKHQEFSEAISIPKDVADSRVEQSLYRRAMGYEHDEVDIRVVGGEIVETPIRKYYPPDSVAMMFWLKNRQSDKWREVKAVELTGANGGPVETKASLDVAKLSSAALEELIALRDADND